MRSFKKLIRKYKKDDIEFTKHAKIKLDQTDISEDFIKEKLFTINDLIYEEFQKERKTYKLILIN